MNTQTILLVLANVGLALFLVHHLNAQQVEAEWTQCLEAFSHGTTIECVRSTR